MGRCPGDTCCSALLSKVSFDATKHLSDASIKKRQLERQKLQELEQQRELQKRREKEAEERQRAEERCARVCTCAFAAISVCTCMRLRVSALVCVCICLWLCTCVHLCVCVCLFLCIHMCHLCAPCWSRGALFATWRVQGAWPSFPPSLPVGTVLVSCTHSGRLAVLRVGTEAEAMLTGKQSAVGSQALYERVVLGLPSVAAHTPEADTAVVFPFIIVGLLVSQI